MALQPRHAKPVFFFLYRNISVIDSSISKAFDHIPREMIWWALKKSLIEREYFSIMADTFLLITSFFRSAHRITFITTSLQIDGERSEEFEVIVGV